MNGNNLYIKNLPSTSISEVEKKLEGKYWNFLYLKKFVKSMVKLFQSVRDKIFIREYLLLFVFQVIKKLKML